MGRPFEVAQANLLFQSNVSRLYSNASSTFVGKRPNDSTHSVGACHNLSTASFAAQDGSEQYVCHSRSSTTTYSPFTHGARRSQASAQGGNHQSSIIRW